ncbi:LysR substrate-binding domain-containing protein [Chitinimonas sp.]|uniref:LysR substrate-binding domain-containing protein n=1 Tax=Chitinimonas sp. TaxID=1934313 RepID=UPI0035B008F0
MSALPSLAALRSFDALARHLHFRRAADELSVSHAAISQQIRQLELDLGVQLFQRSRAGVALTAEGRRLLTGVAPAFGLLRDAVDSVRRGRSQAAPASLRVSLLPSLATCWLYARLPDWYACHPELNLELETTTRVVALGEAGAPDAAIRFGNGDWPGCVAEKLCDDWLVAVISPALRARLGAGPAESLFSRATLLRHYGAAWPQWLRQVGLPPQAGKPGPLFQDAGVMVEACKAGQGIALARRTLVADALAAGTLLRAHPAAVPADGANYLVYADAANPPGINSLRNWLVRQVDMAGYRRAP